MKMDYKKWLDDVVETYKRLVELDKQGGKDVVLCISDIDDVVSHEIRIHIFRGIRKLADAVGAELFEQSETSYRNHEFYFLYNGCRLFSLEDR
jgi:hypothetical protein